MDKCHWNPRRQEIIDRENGNVIFCEGFVLVNFTESEGLKGDRARDVDIHAVCGSFAVGFLYSS